MGNRVNVQPSGWEANRPGPGARSAAPVYTETDEMQGGPRLAGGQAASSRAWIILTAAMAPGTGGRIARA